MMSEQEIYDLCRAAGITLTSDGNLAVAHAVSAETVEAIKLHKSEIVDALAGYCFSRAVYSGCGIRNWQIAKGSVIAAADYPPVTVFEGTAGEVDAWAKDHARDPFFTDRYTSKYFFGHQSTDD